MSIGNLLYQLILGPLELVFDVIYSLACQITEHPGTAIVFLSLAMNFLVLPLYRRADAMQEEERLQSMRMKPGIDQIRKMFKGDERFMILQTYYRQNNYKPYYALKGSLSLLLEIPFFIAAYRYLSGLSLLQGASFGPIRDLGSPDELIRLGGISLNLLPILIGIGQTFGTEPMSIAVAMVLCRMTGCFISLMEPSTLLGTGLAEVDIKDHIWTCFPYVWAFSFLCILFAVAMGKTTF